MTDRPAPAVYSIRECCQLLGLSHPVLYERARGGWLVTGRDERGNETRHVRVYRVGGRVLVLKAELDRFLNPPATEAPHARVVSRVRLARLRRDRPAQPPPDAAAAAGLRRAE